MFDRVIVELAKMHSLPCSRGMPFAVVTPPITADDAPRMRWPASAT